MNLQIKSLLFQALDHLLSQEVISLVLEDKRFLGCYSNLLMVLRQNGHVVTILDLKKLKKCLLVQTLQMKSICSVVYLLQSEDFLASVAFPLIRDSCNLQ